MEYKFKKGDIVNTKYGKGFIKIVDKNAVNLVYCVENESDGISFWCEENQLTLMEKRKFKFEDIEVGMMVEKRNGELCVVIKNIGDNDYCPTNKYPFLFVDNSGFTVHREFKNRNFNQYDIVKVYDNTAKLGNGIFDITQRNLLWEEKEDVIKEMTIDEIQKELGYEIKIIKGE